ncbi:uncharacterized protein LOC109713364 [Ananas comosus]|uniref:Uncharacterized protein LOC109713364 n=1 Tax=Ananas comosus TaxID=4615 RepID=A0A6P5FHQ9_ANACO|nr:uncharacterized protein LOC109713364 [Ananas comosus]
MDANFSHHQEADDGGATAKKAAEKPSSAAAANRLLILISLLGAGMLVWWAAVFHPSNRQLWMVPLGLLLAGTPVVVLLSVFASDAGDK